MFFAVLNSEGDSKKENGMNIENKTLLVTGANRGIGRALVNEALRRGAKKRWRKVKRISSRIPHPRP